VIGVKGVAKIDYAKQNDQKDHQNEGLFNQASATLSPYSGRWSEVFLPQLSVLVSASHCATRICSVLVTVIDGPIPG
jgi:hypothetical protein